MGSCGYEAGFVEGRMRHLLVTGDGRRGAEGRTWKWRRLYIAKVCLLLVADDESFRRLCHRSAYLDRLLSSDPAEPVRTALPFPKLRD